MCVSGTGEHEQCLFIIKHKVGRLFEHEVRLYDPTEYDAYLTAPTVLFIGTLNKPNEKMIYFHASHDYVNYYGDDRCAHYVWLEVYLVFRYSKRNPFDRNIELFRRKKSGCGHHGPR